MHWVPCVNWVSWEAIGLFVVGLVAGLGSLRMMRRLSCEVRKGHPRRRLFGTGLIALAIVSLAGVIVSGLWTLARARELGKRPVDASSLRQIGKCLLMYENDHGAYPPNLRTLIGRYISERDLHSVAWGWRQGGQGQAQEQPFLYIPLPAERPNTLVWAWSQPYWYEDEGAYVLYADGRVEWVSPARLMEDLGQTLRWLAGQARAETRPVLPQPAGPVGSGPGKRSPGAAGH